jgi:hypothetical protein
VHELARVIRARPRRNAKGGGRPAAGERRRGVRLGKNKREAGRSFLTTRKNLRRERGQQGRRRRRRSAPAVEIQRVAMASSIGRKGTGEGGWGARCE